MNSQISGINKFGGFFQRGDSGCGGSYRQGGFGNYLNNDRMDCPSGFREYKFGRILHPETKCGSYLYYCLKWNKVMKIIKTIKY